MKRGGRLARRTPLRAHKPLERRTPLRSAAPLRPKRGHRIPVDVAAVVAERSGGRCEFGLLTCDGVATQKHHRITQKAGGRHRAGAARSDRPSNIVHSCAPCHRVVTEYPSFAYEYGWSLRERQEPTQEPVLYRGVWVYLDDAGGVHDYERAGA